MRRFPLILILGACIAGAQPAADQKSIHVEGTIVSLNGDAVRKATVRLQGAVLQPGQPPGMYSETTDNAGNFVFEDVAPGRYTLSAEKPGFVTTRYGARSNTSPGSQLTLTAGMELKSLSIKMTPQGVIAGKVLDQDGDPVASALVQVLRMAYVRGRRQAQPTGAGSTNDLGEFRVSNLAPGRYYISATDSRTTLNTPERAGHSGEAQEGNIMTFYPNGTDVSSAAPVDVAAGGELRGL
jgi:hypothetical protein